MWREPNIHEIDAPKEIRDLINSSIFYNRKGILRHADDITIYQYTFALLVGSIMFSGVASLLIGLIFDIPLGLQFNVMMVIITMFVLAGGFGWFIYWGWYQYEQAWYKFDHDNEVFTVTRLDEGNWEVFDIPYSTVNKVEWSGGNKGFARIHTAGFKFDTTRAGTERFASVTELWPNLARFDTNMSNWPIIMICPQCDREFGHHIGTAQCPFDEMLLVDPEIKGRIDPEEMHPDDIERV